MSVAAMDAELMALTDAVTALRTAIEGLTPRRGEDATVSAIRSSLGRIEAEVHSLTLRRGASATLCEARGAPGLGASEKA